MSRSVRTGRAAMPGCARLADVGGRIGPLGLTAGYDLADEARGASCRLLQSILENEAAGAFATLSTPVG